MAEQVKLPIPALQKTAYTTKRAKRQKTEQEQMEFRKRKREMATSRVYIGAAFERWRKLKESKGLKSDAQLALLLLESPTSLSTTLLCYAEGCANGENLLQQWSMNKCDVHGCFLGLDSCTCEPPFRLFPFPTQKQDPDRRQRWIQAFKRPDPWKPKRLLPPRRGHRVCSAHFVDGAPSEANPDPTLNLRHSSLARDNDGTRPQGLKRRRIDGPNPALTPLPTEIAAPSAVFYTLSVIIGVLLSLWRKAAKEKDGLSKENQKLKAEVNQLRSQVSKLKELINGLETNRVAESKEKSTALPEPLTSGNNGSQRKEIQNWSVITVQPHKTSPAPSQSHALEMTTQEKAKSQAQLAVQTATHPATKACQVYLIYQPVGQPMLVSTQQTSTNNQVASISNSSTQQTSTDKQVASISNSSTQQPSTNNQMASISNSSTQQPSTINQMASILNYSTQRTSTNKQLDSIFNLPSSGENVKTEPVMVSLKCEDTEERTERKAECLLSGEQENVLNNIKKEEKEEDWEENSVKMECDIRVRADDVCLKEEEG